MASNIECRRTTSYRATANRCVAPRMDIVQPTMASVRIITYITRTYITLGADPVAATFPSATGHNPRAPHHAAQELHHAPAD